MAGQRSQIAVGIALAAVAVGYVALRPARQVAHPDVKPARVAEVVGEAGVTERPKAARVPRATIASTAESWRIEPVPVPRKLLRVRPPTGVAATAPAPTVAERQPEPEEVMEPAVPLPVAREALALAGADEEATAVWAAAINDPTLSPHDRSDLIEDLNEVGIDPRNLTPDDLPLIVSRLEMIEELAPDAMDQTNLDAFEEAYKDLSNMYARVTGQP